MSASRRPFYRSTRRSAAAVRCAASCPDRCPRRRCAKSSHSRNGRPPTATCSPGPRTSSPAPALKRLREALVDAGMRDEPIKPDWPADTKFVGVYRERQVDAAQRLYGAMGVERRDLVARKLAYVRNHAFFDAPHVVFVFMPEPFRHARSDRHRHVCADADAGARPRGASPLARRARSGCFRTSCASNSGWRPTTDCCSASRSATKIRRPKPTRRASGALAIDHAVHFHS